MPSWLVFLAILCLAACSGPSRSIEETLPAQLQGWSRGQVSPLAPAEAPDIVRQLGLKRAATAAYAGPATVQVRIYEMNVPASAFELIQKWRQQDGLAAYSGPYFLVADASAAAEASDLLAKLTKELK